MPAFSIRAATEVLTGPEFPREAVAIRRDACEMRPIHAVCLLVPRTGLQRLDAEPVNMRRANTLSFFSDHIRHKPFVVFNRQS